MELQENFLKREDVMIIFTTSPAGLGHIRVTEALRGGLPKSVNASVIGITDKNIQYLHRITSISKPLRELMEFTQSTPFAEEIFTRVYRKSLKRGTKSIYSEISGLIKHEQKNPKYVVIVATHFSLAHKIAVIKDRLAHELNTCVMLCVVVTDDSPQKIWGVTGADYIFVPSVSTKEKLEEFLKLLGGTNAEVIVNSYPISPLFLERLTKLEFNNRRMQLRLGGTRTKIIIPISGAAVQLDYFSRLIEVLNANGGFEITIVARNYIHTHLFLNFCRKFDCVQVLSDRHDERVVELYENEISKNIYAVEITKPSEQSFKALVPPSRKGGIVLLFSESVGRQEYDNVKFLRRHNMIPDEFEMQNLIANFTNNCGRYLTENAKNWRGILLPNSGVTAAKMIINLKTSGFLENMLSYKRAERTVETRRDGVKQFWKKLSSKAGIKCQLIYKSE